MFEHKRLPNARRWEREMAKIRGADETAVFLSRVQARYEELLAQAPFYDSKALRSHFEGNILPAVAVYSVLMMDETEQDTAFQTLDRLLEASIEPARRMYRFWGRFPFFFDMIRLAIKPMMHSQYPEEWNVEWIEFTRDRVGLNCHSCFYLKHLTDYGFPELTPHFCRLDDLLAAEAAPSVRLERTKTLASGGTMCDFRYLRVKTH